jgi:hypothetical protein
MVEARMLPQPCDFDLPGLRGVGIHSLKGNSTILRRETGHPDRRTR